MNRGTLLSRAVVCALVAMLAGGASLWGQTAAVRSRVVEVVDDTRTVRLQGNVHPLARTATDQGALADSQPLTRMLLLLQRSPEQDLALQKVLEAQQTKGSGSYHAWLTPEQFGKLYGPSDADVQAVTDWLTKQGFQVKNVAAGRTVIEFDGNVAQVRNAFHTEIHKFTVDGKERFANVSDPQIPVALTPVVAGVVALDNFPRMPQIRNRGLYRRVAATGEMRPLFTYGNPANYAVGPADFATIYNVPAAATGAGQSIAVIAQTNINPKDICDFRTMFGLVPACPAYETNNLQVVLNGPDPGIVGPKTATDDEGESDLDVEWAGAVAPAAKIVLVASQSTFSNASTQVSQGVDLSALYAVDNNLAPVISDSYGNCEAFLLTAGNQFYNAVWGQAAAQGITVAVASGDNGSASCDSSSTETAATSGIAVSGLASTPYNVAVGGTDFDSTTQNNTYWSATNGATQGSAIQYMPESTWNDSTCAINFPTACTSVDPNGFDLVAAGGGPSNCIQGTADNSGNVTCATNGTFPKGIGYAKPTWQVGITPTPTDNSRDLPDVSFFSSNGQNGVALIVCQADANSGSNTSSCDLNSPYQDFLLVGGTSAATPTFAAVMAMVNQQTGERQGNANYVLYGLAAKDANYTTGKCVASLGSTPAASCVYNDVSKGNNSVACVGGSPNCSQGSGFGVLTYSLDNGNPAFQAVAGYDLATGLGSINVTKLLAAWSTFARTATTTTLSGQSSNTNVSGQAFSVNVTVSPAPTTAGETVSLIATTPSGQQGFGPFMLVGGTVKASTNLLPPGTTSIVGYYAGDATHAASTSAPLALTVNGSGTASKTTLSWVAFDSNGNPVLSTAAQNVSYGSNYILQVAVTGPTACAPNFNYPNTSPTIPCPTGTVALTDNGSPLNDFPNGVTSNATNVAKLNSLGITEDQPVQLTPGSHSIMAAYTPEDTNYTASTSNTLSVTVTKATTQVAAFSSVNPVPAAGTVVTLSAYVVTSSNGAGPSGTMTFTNGSTSLGTANCAPTIGSANTNPPISGMNAGTAYCLASLPNVAISALYPPPGSGPKTPVMPVTPIVVALLSLALFALGLKWMPQPRRQAYAYLGMLALALVAAGIVACGGGSGGGGGGGGGSRTITAAYPGDGNYGSSSGTVTITIQ